MSHELRNKLERWPPWSEKALQGLAFWIGHRHSLYAHYPLGEAALVAETCNLIHANLGPTETLLCERQYADLLPSQTWPAKLGPRSRADLVIVENVSAQQVSELPSLVPFVSVVIEIKRASAPKALIDQDLKRLATLKKNNPKVRAMLFVVAEAHRPQTFVDPEGKSIRGKQPIPGFKHAHYRVRRTCKAAAAFSGKESAHYACIIEVFIDSKT